MTYGQADSLTGSRDRNDIFMNVADAERLQVEDGEEILLRSEVGEFRGRARFADIRQGNLQGYWPEGNVLIPRVYDPISHEPDYNAVVEVQRLPALPE
jgi:anaerobic selenocysteine-containing dehydrogenase